MIAVFVGIATWMCTMVYYEKNPNIKYVEKVIEKKVEVPVEVEKIVEIEKTVYVKPKVKCIVVEDK